MSQNLPYFDGLFRQGSNWSENKQKTGIKEITIPCENPDILADYLKSLFCNSLTLTPENCSEIYHYASYFQDDLFIGQIEEFIRKNITKDNFLGVIKYEKFCQEVKGGDNLRPEG